MNGWVTLYNQRNNWAFNALECFRQSLVTDDARQLCGNAEGAVTVAVYGTSQVGKSTLILKLMGIATDWFELVYSTLRGTRSCGQSATATAMIYLHSADDQWRFRIDGEAEIVTADDSVVADHVDHVRSLVENGSIRSEEPIYVEIPGKYFDLEHDGLKVNVLDLPGIASSEAKEHEHVEALVRRHLPLADLVLIVVRANDLTVLKNIEIPQIADWRFQPERFRVVLTYSASDNSTQSKIKADETLCKEKFRNVFLNEIPSDVGFPVEMGPNLYPLEYGNSWQNFSEKVPNVFARISPIIDDLFTDLVSDLKNAATPLSRLEQTTKLAPSLEKVRKNYQDRWADLQASLMLDEKELNRKLSSVADELETQQATLEKLQNKLISEKAVLELLDNRQLEPLDCSNEKTVKGLEALLFDARNKVDRCVQSWLYDWYTIGPKLAGYSTIAKESMDTFDEAIEGIADKLDGYLTPKYISWTGNYDTDKKKCFEDIEYGFEFAKKTVQISLQIESVNHNRSILIKTKCIEEDVASFSLRKRDILEAIESFNLQKESEENEQNRKLSAIDKDIKSVEGFGTLMQENYDSERLKVVSSVNDSATSGEDKLLQILYLYSVSRGYRRLRSMGNFG